MSSDDIAPNIRAELIRLCETSRCRNAEFSRDRPTRWSPSTVINPTDSDGRCFTDNTAWEYIAERLKAGQQVEIIVLDLPPGKKGYVMKIPQTDGNTIYIKLQFGRPGVLGRSFHYSDH